MPEGYAAMQIVPTLVTGGVAPYTYQWTINDSRVSITGANSPSPTLQTWISYCGFLATTGAVTMTDSRGVISTSRFNFVAMDAFCGGGGGA